MFLNDSRVFVPLGMIRNTKRAAVPNRASVQLMAFESDIGVSCFRCWGMAFVRSSLTCQWRWLFDVNALYFCQQK